MIAPSRPGPAPTPPGVQAPAPRPAAQALRQAAQILTAAGADSPRLTAEALLAHHLGAARAWLLARPELALTPEQQTAFQAQAARAAAGEPLAYLTGRREFCGLEFTVDRRVLVPRPETELLVDRALAFLDTLPAPAGADVVDVGTGSGCIAVSLAVQRPAARVTAGDVSAEALQVARLNVERHGVAGRVRLVRADLLAGLGLAPASVDLMCANLPYIPAETARSLPVARHEPLLALDGGPDGLDLIRRLLAEAPTCLRPGGCLLLEIEAGQGPAARAEAQAAFPQAAVHVHADLAGWDRIVEIRR